MRSFYFAFAPSSRHCRGPCALRRIYLPRDFLRVCSGRERSRVPCFSWLRRSNVLLSGRWTHIYAGDAPQVLVLSLVEQSPFKYTLNHVQAASH